MEIDLAALFAEVDVAPTEPKQAQKPQTTLASHDLAIQMSVEEHDHGGVILPDAERTCGSATHGDLPFGMQIDTYAEDTVNKLSQKCEVLEQELHQQKKAYDDLERRVYKKAVADVDLPAEVLRRLRRLEGETERQQTQNKQLREDLKFAESEVTMLRNEVEGQKNRLKGAGKKVRNAKDVAEKQDEKAKDAVRGKQLRVSSERKMKLERNEAVAKVASLTKQCDDLQSNLEVETSGRPHLRKTDASSDEGIAVMPIEITMRRVHYPKLSAILECNQMSITEQMQHWYEDWKKLQEGTQHVVGATYIKDNKNDGKPAVDLEKLYADMVELVDGHQQTGAEHDGPRSRNGLDTICRKAEKRHNCKD